MESARELVAHKHTLATVEGWYRQGSISQHTYEVFCYIWCHSAVRYSQLCAGLYLPDVADEGKQLMAEFGFTFYA